MCSLPSCRSAALMFQRTNRCSSAPTEPDKSTSLQQSRTPLNRPVEDGLIDKTPDRSLRDENECRRYYQLTPSGRAVAHDEVVRLQGLLHRIDAHVPGTATAGATGQQSSSTAHCPRPTIPTVGDASLNNAIGRILDEK